MLQNILSSFITKQISNRNAFLIDFGYFFGCLRSCLIDTEDVRAKNTYIGSAYIGNTYTKDAYIEGVYIRLFLSKVLVVPEILGL